MTAIGMKLFEVLDQCCLYGISQLRNKKANDN
jgi:hypothetical protein